MLNKRGYTIEKGFTLIELLIVVSIIGILAGVTLNILNSNQIRMRPRDSQRVSDLGKLQTALELYFADTRRYPVLSSWTAVNNTTLAVLRTGSYISTIPTDPSGATGATPCSGGNFYSYRTNAAGSLYVLTARTELADTANRSACANLSNWSTLGGCAPAAGSCYGVQNP